MGAGDKRKAEPEAAASEDAKKSRPQSIRVRPERVRELNRKGKVAAGPVIYW